MRQRVSTFVAALISLALSTGMTSAAFLRDVPVTVRQPDGSTFEALVTGDEFHHWVHRGKYLLMRGEDGWVRWAARGPSGPVASGLIARGAVPWFGARWYHGIEPGLQPAVKPADRFPLLQQRGAEARQVRARLANLTFFVRFADDPPFTRPFSWYEDTLTSAYGNSVARYFSLDSGGVLTVLTTFAPRQSGGQVVAYQDRYERGYYQPRTLANPIGYRTESELVMREQTLIARVVTEAGPSVPAGTILDYDGDGNVDNVTVIVQGAPDGWSDLLWPHRWVLYAAHAEVLGKAVYDFNFQLDAVLTVGVLCHELSHSLGAPDLYRYPDCSSKPSVYPVERWDLMSHDLDPPQRHLWWLRHRYFGWVGQPPVTRGGMVTLLPGQAVAVQAPDGTLIIAEYRSRADGVDTSLPDSGLIVYRVDTSRTGNECGPPDEVWVYRPGSTGVTNGDPAMAPLNPERSAMGPGTDPPVTLTGDDVWPLRIHHVGGAGASITFFVDLPGGVTTVTPPPGGWP